MGDESMYRKARRLRVEELRSYSVPAINYTPLIASFNFCSSLCFMRYLPHFAWLRDALFSSRRADPHQSNSSTIFLFRIAPLPPPPSWFPLIVLLNTPGFPYDISRESALYFVANSYVVCR